MKIAFVLHERSLRPVGGYKIVYEYANRLAERGHEVAVVHPWSLEKPSSRRAKLAARAWVEWLCHRRASVVPWFSVDRRVDLVVVPSVASFSELSADAIVATAWETAVPVADATGRNGARGFYLIQHLEPWDDPEEVLESWRLPLHKIVIARWLEDIAVEIGEGERTTWIPNGLDFSELGVDVPPAEREPRVGVLISPLKGVDEVIAAVSAARERIPQLGACGYGARRRPAELPEWFEYVRLPSPEGLRALYNSCSIFLQASRSEGWGLPATEAMACGCALVTYDNGGSREYARPGETAAGVTEHGPEHLAEAIVELVHDRELRLAYAERGRALVETFTWPRAVAKLEQVLETGGGECAIAPR